MAESLAVTMTAPSDELVPVKTTEQFCQEFEEVLTAFQQKCDVITTIELNEARKMRKDLEENLTLLNTRLAIAQKEKDAMVAQYERKMAYKQRRLETLQKKTEEMRLKAKETATKIQMLDEINKQAEMELILLGNLMENEKQEDEGEYKGKEKKKPGKKPKCGRTLVKKGRKAK